MPPEGMTLSRVSDAERGWIASQRQIGCVLVGAYTGTEPTAPTLGELDEFWAAWMADPNREKSDPNTVVNAVGACFGLVLAAELSLAWVIATDPYGTELALHGDPGDIILFPQNMVAKRFEAQEQRFIAALGAATIESVRRFRTQA